MITTDKFVFLHLHKSGGTFVNGFLLRFVPDAQLVGYHLPRKMIPPAHVNMPVLGFVRSPWSYYVSWFAFQSQRPQPNALYRLMSRDGTLGFEATIGNLLHLGADAGALKEAVDVLPNGYRNTGMNLPGYELAAIGGSGQGFYSFLYDHIYGGAGVTLIGRMDRLRAELASMLAGLGQPVDSRMREYLERAPAQNESTHGSHRDYYGDALRTRIEKCDASVIERHAYRFADCG